MARSRRPRSPYGDIYAQLMIQRLMQKAQDRRRLEEEAAANTPPPGPGVPPLEEGTWSAAPGARNTNVPYQGDILVPGYGAYTGGDELYGGAPYFDHGRNWSSPAQWERYNDHGMTADGTLRLPDWLRTSGSGLGPAYVPSPEHTELARQLQDLKDLKISLSALAGGGMNGELMRRDKERTLAYQAMDETFPGRLPDPQGPDWRSRINAGIYPGGPNWSGPPAQSNTTPPDASRIPRGTTSATPEEIAARDAAWGTAFDNRRAALERLPAHLPASDAGVRNIMDSDMWNWAEVNPTPEPTRPPIVQGLDRNIFPLQPADKNIANIYGPYDPSMDRYADAPPQPSMIEEAYPENAMPPPEYRWGAEGLTPDTGYIISDPITRSGSFPERFSATPKGRQAAATALDFARPLNYERGPIPKGTKDAIEVESQRPTPSAGPLPVGEDSPPPGRAPYLMPPGAPAPQGNWGLPTLAGGDETGPWGEATAQPPGPPPPQMPEPGGLWDNYDPEFVAAMHSGDPNQIERINKGNKLWEWQ